MAEITNSLNYQQYTPSPVGEGWGEGKKTKGFPMFLCPKLIIKAVYKYCLIFRIGIIFTVDAESNSAITHSMISGSLCP